MLDATEGNLKQTLATGRMVQPLFLRPEQVLELIPISRRTLSNWQRQGRLKFYKVARTILFRRSDIETCVERFAVAAVGEPKPRRSKATK